MSLHANPILYLNMGGEMLYVVQQRLKAQKIDTRKATQVLDDVTAALLNPNIISVIFQKSPIQELSWMRSTLESIALSSIMKLDKDSMNKLFDLMIMMVKYQLVAATGPREVILITLNHLDSMREIITRTNTHEWIALVHRTLTDYYGDLTHEEIWQARNDCLDQLKNINVRVSILLRQGLQNEDTTFNINPKNYNERYLDRESELGPLKLIGAFGQGCHIGSLKLFGDRVTLLGKNMYSSNYGNPPKSKPPGEYQSKTFYRTKISKAEINLLAKQLGTDNSDALSESRSFNFDLLIDELDTPKEMKSHNGQSNDYDNNDTNKDSDSNKFEELDDEKIEKLDISEYKSKLENMCADIMSDTEPVEKKINLLKLLDESHLN